MRHLLISCAVILIIAVFAPLQPPAAAAERRCFSETDYCIEGRIAEFWAAHGGLPVFGLPISPQQQEVVEGRRLTVQWFERNRLELHPDQAPPYDVQIGRVGVQVLEQQGRNWQNFPRDAQQSACRFFAETGHSLCEPFLSYWNSQGLEFDGTAGISSAESLALFGAPVSNLRQETLADGRRYTVQWFERARFELHPDNAPPYTVLLGRLGAELRVVPAPTPTLVPTRTLTPTPTPTQTPTPTRRPRPEPRPEPPPPTNTPDLPPPTTPPTVTIVPYP